MQHFFLVLLIYENLPFQKNYFVDKPERGLFCTSFCSFQDGVKFGSVVIMETIIPEVIISN